MVQLFKGPDFSGTGSRIRQQALEVAAYLEVIKKIC